MSNVILISTTLLYKKNHCSYMTKDLKKPSCNGTPNQYAYKGLEISSYRFGEMIALFYFALWGLC